MSDRNEFDLACIGSGAAAQAAKSGKGVAAVKKRRNVSGLCLGTGTIPGKTFREAVLSFVAHNCAAARSSTQQISARPTADQLFSRVEQVGRHEVEVVKNQLWRNDIESMQGEASFADPHTLGLLLAVSSAVLYQVGTSMPTWSSGYHPSNCFHELRLRSQTLVWRITTIPRDARDVGISFARSKCGQSASHDILH
ncbi:MAG: hypothetical protein KGS09_10815 [Nitrospirae bacterium]|nr:hypothetical protein [Nitrospirota bacterium]MDE3218652.1 hypothetical protein [Nitrospirota bacterium]